MNFTDKINILWADDEIDLLKPHIMFLEERGYKLVTANNGATALDLVSEQHFDLVFLDENMPGLTGLEPLVQIKNKQPNLPVIMIAKSEEEYHGGSNWFQDFRLPHQASESKSNFT